MRRMSDLVRKQDPVMLPPTATVLEASRQMRECNIGEVMTGNPECLTRGHLTIDALRLMQDARCRHLPTVKDGGVVGIVSRGDFRGLEQDRLDEETGLWERIG